MSALTDPFCFDKSLTPILAQAVAESPNGIMIVKVTGDERTTVFVNRGFETITGYSASDVVGKWPGRLHAGDMDQAQLQVLRQALIEQKAVAVTLRNYRKDGSLFWNSLNISPVHDEQGLVTHFLGIMTDVTREKCAEDALTSSRLRLDALTAMSADGMVTFDENHRLSYANEAFLRLMGLSESDLTGIDIAALDQLFVQQSAASHPYHLIEDELEGMEGEGGDSLLTHEIVLSRPRRMTLLRIVRKKSAGASQLIYFQDITKHRQIEDIKSEFLATAAHELRTPMTSILGYSELLLERDFDAETRHDLLETIHRQASRVTDILNELLDLARIEARRGKDFNFEVQDLKATVLAAQKTFLESASRVVVTMPDEELLIRMDSTKMLQAVTNVLSNALKFSKSNDAVMVSAQIRAEQSPPMVELTIEDRGIGMLPEQLGRLGERFFRADTSGKIPGTGLGVSLVKEIVAVHGGTHEVTSMLGKGTRVTIRLPAALGRDHSLMSQDASTAQSAY